MSEPCRSDGVPVLFMSGRNTSLNAINRFSRDPSPRGGEASRPLKDGQTKGHCTGRDNVMDRASIQALQNAELFTGDVAEFRTVYTSDVVERIRPSGAVERRE